MERDEEIVFVLAYCTKLFKKETISRLIHHFLNILTGIVENPGKNLAEIEMLSREERDQILLESTRASHGGEYDF